MIGTFAFFFLAGLMIAAIGILCVTGESETVQAGYVIISALILAFCLSYMLVTKGLLTWIE